MKRACCKTNCSRLFAVKSLFASLFVGDAALGVPSVFLGFDAPKIQKYWQAAGNPPIEDGFPDGTPRAASPTNLFDKQKFDSRKVLPQI